MGCYQPHNDELCKTLVHTKVYYPFKDILYKEMYRRSYSNRKRSYPYRKYTPKKAKARSVTINGPFGTSVKLPIPKLPLRIGSDTSLGVGRSIYPVLNGLSIPIGPTQSSMTSGAMASVISINPSIVNQWSTRYAATFDEYCIVGLSFEIRSFVTPGSADQAGYGAFFLDEKDSAAPTASNMFASPRIEVMNPSVYAPVPHYIEWKASDVADLNWLSTSITANTPVYLKGFGSTADTFTTTGTNINYVITGTLAVSFRGWKN